MLEIKNLSKSFHENKVLDHINLKIEKGDVVGIIGPSGTGKSTLLRCINQLEIPEEGEAVFGGKTVDLSKKHKDSLEFRKSTGMVFQRFYLFEKKTALENVMEGLMVVQKKSKADAKAAADKYDETLAQIQTDKADYETRKNNAAAWLAKYEENNPENLDTAERLKQAEEHNKINALVVDYLTKKKQKEAAEKVAQTHEKKLSDLLKERENLIAKSELPIAGLTFTDDGLELNGVPFVAGKVSDSQIMEVAAKLIIASNPTVKVFRIARGESLGAKRLQSLIELARKEGYQGFIEEVKRGQDDLIIEEYSETE